MTIVKDYKKGTFLFPSDDDIRKADEFISESMKVSIIVDGSILTMESIIVDLNDIQLYALVNLIAVVMNVGNTNIIDIANAPEEITSRDQLENNKSWTSEVLRKDRR